MGKIVNSIKAVPVFTLKTLYIMPFFLFGLWLLQMLYFPEVEIEKYLHASKSEEEIDVFKKILINKDQVPRDHFHMVDEYISQPEPNPPICLTCHGNYPHGKEKEIRSILNFHTGFIACSSCHARKDIEDEHISFAWVDHKTGLFSKKANGAYGKYSGKIFPIKKTENSEWKIFRPVNEKAAQKLLELKDRYSPDQIAQAKIKLHAHISPKPVFCSDCHQKNGYLDFEDLGFPKQRIAHLDSTEVIGMINKYKTFYLPSVIDFRSGSDSK